MRRFGDDSTLFVNKTELWVYTAKICEPVCIKGSVSVNSSDQCQLAVHKLLISQTECNNFFKNHKCPIVQLYYQSEKVEKS